MGLLTDLNNWLKSVADFFGIEEATADHMPAKTPEEKVETIEESGVQELKPIEPVTEEKPSVPEPTGIAPIGEQGRADRIATEPAPSRVKPEAPFTEPASEEDYPCTMTFQINGQVAGSVDVGGGLVMAGLGGANVNFDGKTATTDHLGQCTIKTTAKIYKNYTTTVSKAGYKTQTQTVSWAFPPRSGTLSAKQFFYMELV